MVINNPFRFRATEQLRQLTSFHSTFGVEMLSALPDGDELWDRLIVLRSAPGAGKTSLLKLFSAESLAQLTSYVHPEPSVHLLRQDVAKKGALRQTKIAKLGVLLSLRPDYKTLIDLGPNGPGSSKVLFKLLDARILQATVEALSVSAHLPFLEGLDRIEFHLSSSDIPGGGTALRQLLGDLEDPSGVVRVTAGELYRRSRAVELEVLSLLDSLVPVEWDNIDGHAKLYSLAILERAGIYVDGNMMSYEPLLLIDDVDELHPEQREAVYAALISRDIKIARWIAERQAAVPSRELLGRTEGRDLKIIYVDDASVMSEAKRHRLFKHVADSRGVAGLQALDVHTPFTDLLEGEASIEQKKLDLAYNGSRSQVEAYVRDHPAYTGWLLAARERATRSNPLEAAIIYRETLIRIDRERSRASETLFDFDFENAPEVEETGTPQSKDKVAARLFLSDDYQLPYYYGAEALSVLASRNVEQYLRVAGEHFDTMVAAAARRSRNRNATLTAADQDRLIRRSSRDFWNSIPQRVNYGADVLALLTAIAAVSVEQTYRKNAPYAPGVTGTAIPYLQRNALFADSGKDGSPTSRLRNALASAVSENLLEMSGEIARVKNQDLILLHLNRLLLPALKLPLQRSGFREQSVAVLSRRMAAVADMKLDASRALTITPTNVPGWPR
ncbi:ORC-CDC6 family AAA ATPase [Plantibacter sp. CFBP 8775]|uniref:ORC-CDC6 family AAA ATPase n=1 Tax=Plantibacter sp. CFBP 8775 TaxID=2774038 RepID=UPI00178096CB|nr:hypothetical protein [Plantibacter sp. CFBP 8775]MBD8103218.1 hypothetical protein [Plantibacter sp. CFBP 8775]